MKRRDITLGEMQDECRRINGVCVGLAFVTEDCKYKSVCPFQMQSRKALAWDLSDPPRFNEAQMALLKVFYNRGFRKVITGSTTDALVDCIRIFLGVGENETLDLAALLGKDGEK